MESIEYLWLRSYDLDRFDDLSVDKCDGPRDPESSSQKSETSEGEEGEHGRRNVIFTIVISEVGRAEESDFAIGRNEECAESQQLADRSNQHHAPRNKKRERDAETQDCDREVAKQERDRQPTANVFDPEPDSPPETFDASNVNALGPSRHADSHEHFDDSPHDERNSARTAEQQNQQRDAEQRGEESQCDGEQ